MSDVFENGYPIREGERIAESPITGELYVVTRWEERPEGRIVALEKTPVADADGWDHTSAQEVVSD